jgi:hypothetical protein
LSRERLSSHDSEPSGISCYLIFVYSYLILNLISVIAENFKFKLKLTQRTRTLELSVLKTAGQELALILTLTGSNGVQPWPNKFRIYINANQLKQIQTKYHGMKYVPAILVLIWLLRRNLRLLQLQNATSSPCAP